MNRWLIFILLTCLALPAAARDEELASNPGYVDFGSLESVYGEPRVMINIGGVLLQFMAVAAQASKDEPHAAALMRDLEGVRVNVYDTGGETTPAREKIADVRAVLEEAKWQPVVQVKEKEVQIFMKSDNHGMQGLTVMTVDEEEAVFINILGEIDPAHLNQVLGQLNVDVAVDSTRREQ